MKIKTLPAIEEPPEQTRRNRGATGTNTDTRTARARRRRQRRVNRWRCPTTEAPQSPEHRRPLGRRQSLNHQNSELQATAASQDGDRGRVNGGSPALVISRAKIWGQKNGGFLDRGERKRGSEMRGGGVGYVDFILNF
ncbi:hypothetical protein Fot_27500 [Forsythia ovata]|uniref:Uncharacterized protein n=1 Tax=Forsythia ovata TaxID=205694 RepID=A0ABD1TLC4_9LAMI